MNVSRRTWLQAVVAVAFVLPLVSLNARHADVPKRPLDIEDVIAYRGLGQTLLSGDGQWLAYRMSPTQGDSEVIIRSTSSDKEIKLPVGEGAGGTMLFSEDSKWFAASTAATKRDADAARRASRPAAQAGMTLVNLASSEKKDIAKIRRFTFSGDAGGWIALHRFGADAAAAPGPGGAPGRAGAPGGAPGAGRGTAGDTRPKGTDLVLHELATGVEINVGNVSEFAFNKSGKTLALVIDAADQAGNGVQLRDMATGVVTPIDTDKAFYERLAFTEDGDALSVLKGHDEITAWKDRLYAVVGWTGVNRGAASLKKVMFDPAKDASFPKEMSISNNRTPSWTEGRDAILFGIAKINKADPPAAGRGRAAGEGGEAPAAAPPAAGPDASERPNLVLWHYKDPRLQSAQQVQEASDRAFTYLSTYRVAENKFVRLADDDVRQVSVGAKEKFGIGTDIRAYELQSNLDGRSFRDIYAVNMTTGARTPIKKQSQYGYQISPDGTKYYYYEGKHYFVVDLATVTPKNITEKVPTSFVDVEDDHNTVTPPINPVGWTADSASLILSDGWDMWKVPADGSGAAVNLTVNGKKSQIRYRQRLRLDPDEKGIDLTKPQLIGMMAEWTKKQGLGVLSPSGPGIELLMFDDAAFGRVTKAKNADVWVFSKETSSTSPELYASTNASLSNPKKLTNTNAELEPFAYSPGRMLVDFYNDKKDKAQPKGEKLQGTLYLPAGYEKGKTYPTVVYIYERLTQGTNSFARPSVPGTGFNRAFYLSNGYAVFEPDIKYYVNDPGMSAVWALVPAVKAAIATGVVDPTRVALHGHSWGGYQTAFTITQTSIFKAAAAGAPLTDMISMYALIYKNSGGTNGAIFEASQGRFTSGPWDNWEAYTRNSPVAFAKNVKTPLLMLHNDADGAVDFTQGVEYFNTLRRLGKPVVMVEYPGENHGLARQPNMQDYMIRMKEFFDFYLMDKPAPDWLKDGIPRLKMNDDITERLKAREDAKKKKATDSVKKGGV
ncbi:MAG: S9 family peptidase [Acidobacteria bacterium]|nr:MAG: S9 family peptidase [Acidobacteriota bacterium]